MRYVRLTADTFNVIFLWKSRLPFSARMSRAVFVSAPSAFIQSSKGDYCKMSKQGGNSGGNKKKSLGSWFPTASVIKNTSYNPEDRISLCLFYQYIRPLWTEARKLEAIQYIENHAQQLNIGGRVRVGPEGLNATISSTGDKIREFTRRLGDLDPHFKTTDFKYIEDLPLDRAFKELKVLPVKELVFYGIHAEEELAEGGVHLDPKDYHQKLGEGNTVVIDVRNAYESDIGRFGAQQLAGGAELLTPDMRKSTDFPDWIEREETKEKLQGKNVLMYCTGGVRCERASALLKSKYGDNVAGVYQLQGGIEKYLLEYPDGGYWQGKNFVFDKREAIGVGCFEGVGGIVKDAPKQTKQAKPVKGAEKDKTTTALAAEAPKSTDILGKCCVCDGPWDRYIGKRKCYMCGVPVLLCISCSSAKGMLDKAPHGDSKAPADKSNGNAESAESTTDKSAEKGSEKVGKRQRIKALEAEKKRQKDELFAQKLRVLRCPLCVAQNCTVPADQIIFTANGTKGVYSWGDEGEGGCGESAPVAVSTTSNANKKIKFGDSGLAESATAAPVPGKAAPTVCKWGGGYSAREEKGKSAKKRKIVTDAEGNIPAGTKISRPCKFGSECTRAGCWFQH